MGSNGWENQQEQSGILSDVEVFFSWIADVSALRAVATAAPPVWLKPIVRKVNSR
jgi:hypothetical protein